MPRQKFKNTKGDPQSRYQSSADHEVSKIFSQVPKAPAIKHSPPPVKNTLGEQQVRGVASNSQTVNRNDAENNSTDRSMGNGDPKNLSALTVGAASAQPNQLPAPCRSTAALVAGSQPQGHSLRDDPLG